MIKFPRPRSYIDRPLPRQGMDDRKREELRDAHHSEKSGHVRDRMLAVHCVVNMGMTHEDTADTLMRCPGWVGKWVARYREGGLPALRDLPRSGRPLAVPRTALDGILADASGSPTTPAAVRDRIAGAAGTLFHIASVRRLMREFGLSRKRPRKAHVNRASASAVRSWQRRLAGAAPRLARAGYTMLVQDESIIVNDAGGMATHWTPRTVPVYEPYTGSHERIVVYGAIAEDGRQAFRTRDKFNADTFAQYLAELHGKFGKIAVIVDRAPQHPRGGGQGPAARQRRDQAHRAAGGIPAAKRHRGDVAHTQEGRQGPGATTNPGRAEDRGRRVPQDQAVQPEHLRIPEQEGRGRSHEL